ncbi:hypothetical protein ANO11243_048820 [Dothideomycetidae sp. 11243]|nr:hypothetical protein ANO11243_048820 [fungal sp. No.11243]
MAASIIVESSDQRRLRPTGKSTSQYSPSTGSFDFEQIAGISKHSSTHHSTLADRLAHDQHTKKSSTMFSGVCCAFVVVTAVLTALTTVGQVFFREKPEPSRKSKKRS